MMFGHIETDEEVIAHLMHIRQVQSEKPQHARGFLNFVPWPVQLKGTSLSEEKPGLKAVSADDYIRLMAISRVVLCNVQHIQPSWLTVGVETAQKCLHAGADDFGSIMIEENVVSSAGADHRLNRQSIQEAIRQAGFEPRERNQLFEDVS
jgi:cyclic dehypoxanthinyl futalosine synthase